MRSTFFQAFLLAGAAALSGCDGGSVFGEETTPGGGTTTPPPTTTTPTPTAINLFSSSDQLAGDADTRDEGVVLTAIVTDSNSNTIVGVPVTFRITSGSGALIVTGASTDSSGTATAVLTTGGNTTVPRTISVSATAGSVSDALSVTVVDPTAPPTTPASVSALNLFANAAQLFADADTQAEGVTMTAIVTNANGNVVPDVPVSFVVATGPAAIQVTRGTSDASGTAVAVLTTAGVTTARTVTITASVTSGATTLSDSVSLPVIGHASEILGFLSDVRLPQSGSVLVRARAEDENDNLVRDVPVNLVVSAGTITGGSACVPASNRCTTMTTDSTGQTGIGTITAAGVPPGGVITITLNDPTGSGTADSADILVVPDVNSVALRSSDTNLLDTADTVGEGVTVSAILTSSTGALLPGEPVAFALNNCTNTGASTGALTPSSTVTGDDGTANTIVHTGGDPTFRTINVRAVSLSDPTKCATVALTVTDSSVPPQPPAAVDRVDIFAGASQLFADADTQAEGVTVTAVVTNADGNTVSGVGVAFAVTTDNGAFIVTRATTDASGTASGVLTTGGDRTARTITVQASVPSAATQPTETVNLPVIGHAANLFGTLSAATMPADDSVPVTVQARALDSSNNPVADVPVSFFVSTGAISGGTACVPASSRCTVLTTDSTGTTPTVATITTGGDPTARAITITMTAPGATGDSADIRVIPAVAAVDLFPASGSLFSDADTIAEGLTLSAIARDAGGNAMPGVPITFSVASSAAGRNGLLQNSTGTTDSTGRATVVLTVGNSLDTDVLTVTALFDRTTGTDPSDTSTINVVGRVAGIEVTSSSPQLASDADQQSEGVTITAIVRAGNGNLVTGVPVSFSTTAGALQVTRGTTDSTGTATAILTTGGDPINRTITVTVNADGFTASVDVVELGTHLTITGPDAVGSQQTETYTVTLQDAGGAPLAQRAITLSVANGNTLSASSVTSNSAGSATFTLTGTTGGTETITASALNASTTKALEVSAFDLVFVAPLTSPTEVNFGVTQPVTARLRQNGAPLAGATLLFSTTRGTLSATSAVTDAAGEATVTVSSSGTGGAGLALVQAVGPTSLPVDDRIVASTEIEFIAINPASIDVQAEPRTVPAATPTTTGTSTITAIVRDENGNLVKNRQIDFELTSTVGGSLSPATATTDSLGTATATFTSSSQSSAENGVIVRATERTSGITDTVAMTVGGTALRIAIGTGDDIIESQDLTSYEMPWTAIVTDAAGNPAPPNTVFRLRVLSVEYQKGYYVVCANDLTLWCPNYQVNPSAGAIFGCRNEDVNGNGILDLDEDLDGDQAIDATEDIDGDANFDRGEDVNGNGVLDGAEDIDGDGVIDTTEDLDLDGNFDPTDEDTDADGVLDTHDEDLNNDGDCTDLNESVGPDLVCSTSDVNEDLDGDGNLDSGLEDLDGDTRFDDDSEDIDGDGNFDNANEDANNNGLLDAGEDLDADLRLDDGEDVNHNNVLDTSPDLDVNRNRRLEPGNVASAPTTVPLDAGGRGSFNVVYPKSYGNWVQVRLQAIASVEGTETISEVKFVLPISAEDSLIVDGAPPGTVGASGSVESPYGFARSCANPN